MSPTKPIIKTYSKRQPITRYESRVVLVPSYTDPTHVRESRLNDKTLVVDNFDDTFDRLAIGVGVPSPDNSLGENEVSKKNDRDIFEIFKVPLQVKKNDKPKQKGKSKKKDLVSKAVSVKRKKVDSGSDNSGSNDQEEAHKKKSVKKSKEKVKRAVKRKKNLSPVKLVVNDTVVLSEIVDENEPNNTESNNKEKIKTNDSFKKPIKYSKGNQHKIYFQTSTPRVNRVQSNIDMQDISPVPMEKNKEKEKEVCHSVVVQNMSPVESDRSFSNENKKVIVPVTVPDIPTENTADDEHNAGENFNKIIEGSQHNEISATDNFAKPKKLTKVFLLNPTTRDLLISTPRMNKIHMPVNLQHLSPIILDKEKTVNGDANEKTSSADADIEDDQNHEIESSITDDNVPSEQVTESVKLPTKLDKYQHSNVKVNGEPLFQEKVDASQSNQQELLVSNVINNNEDQRMNEDNLSKIAVDEQDDLLVFAADIESNDKQLLNKTPVVNAEVHENIENIQSFVHSPLLFDDSEWIHLDKSIVVLEKNKTIDIQINFSHSFSEKKKENDKASACVEQVKPATAKDKNLDISNESSFYPHDWTNDYDSSYDYNQYKKNLDKDKTVNSKVDEDENENLTTSSKKSNDVSGENTTEINEVPNVDITEIQTVVNHELEKTKGTICDGVSTMEDSKNETVKQEEHHSIPSISNENNYDSMNVEEDNLQNSQILIEEKQSYHVDESTAQDDEPDESIAKPGDEDLHDQSLIIPARPSKRRKISDTSEITVFDETDSKQANIQNKIEFVDESYKNVSVPLNINGENVDTDDTSLVKSIQTEGIVEKLPKNKDLRIILSRINTEDHKSSILSRKKPKKRNSARRVSRKSKATDDGTVLRKKIRERAPRSKFGIATRRSDTEDKRQQLYIQYQCKEVVIYAVRLEDQRVDLPSRRSLKRKSRDSSIDEDNKLDGSLTNGGLTEFLSKLKDPVKMTMKQKTQKKNDRHLASINEDQAGQNSKGEIDKKVVTWGNDKRVTFNDFRKDSEDTEDNDHRSQPIFLKPGKSWARSLSIINHFHNGRNLDELAAGRENWRHSVQTVLNMQPEVSARNHSQLHKEIRRESHVSHASSHRESKSMRTSLIATNSRFSIRIIPSGKRSTLTDDLMESQRISHVSDRSRTSRKTSLKIRRDTLIETEDDLIRSAKDIIFKRCKQTTYEPFDVCFPDIYIDNCRKIGEGVYGEVFLYENGSEKSVIKIIPIEGDQLVNCEPQKKFHEILSEIIIAEELHKLRSDGEYNTNGFVEVNRIMCVNGKYPKKFIDLWYAYDKQKQSENDCPSMFEENQLYIILELAHGGQDLEAYTFQNASESYAIFLQTALTLAVAEQSLKFEHRDLHWGNLLISKTDDKNLTYKLGSKEISLPTKGVKVTVIDFTLSRLSYQGCKIFNDLAADPTLFEAQGEYQFDIYRMMRENVNDDWQQFNPFTNVLWMDYILDKMITAVRYKKKTTKIHKSAIDNMKALRKEIMNYSSAFDFVTNCKKVQSLFVST